MKIEIEHFYWVPQANGGEPGQSAWHLQVYDVAETMAEVQTLGGQARRARMLTMSQAVAAGFDLKVIGEAFAADAAMQAETAAAALAESEAVREAVAAEAADLRAQVAKLTADLERRAPAAA